MRTDRYAGEWRALGCAILVLGALGLFALWDLARWLGGLLP